MKRTIQVAAVAVLLIFLASCAWSPQEETGSMTLAFSLPAASVSASATVGTDLTKADDADTARVSLFYAGVELPIGPGDQGFVDVGGVSGGRREFKIDNLPEGDEYRVSVVLAATDDDTDVLLPVAYGFSGTFTVTGGRESAVSVETIQLDEVATVEYFDELVGEFLVGAVRTAQTDIVAATDDAVYGYAPDGTPASSPTLPAGVRINSVSIGRTTDGANAIPFLNTTEGILPVTDSNLTLNTPFLNGMSGIVEGDDTSADPDVTGSGAFVVDGSVVYFYQRLGGLGGTSVDSGNPDGDDWVDAGEATAELVEEDVSPVFAQVTNGSDVAYLSTVLGTFQLTEELFESDDEINPADLLDPESDESGLTFFGIAYPGSDRPVRIRHLTLAAEGTADEQLVIGTPRGAFTIPVGGSNYGALGRLQNNGLTDPDDVTTLSAALDQEVRDLTAIEVGGTDIIVVVTSERLIVVDLDEPGESLLNVPTRAFVLGEPISVVAYEEGGSLKFLVAGSQGLTRVSIASSVLDD